MLVFFLNFFHLQDCIAFKFASVQKAEEKSAFESVEINMCSVKVILKWQYNSKMVTGKNECVSKCACRLIISNEVPEDTEVDL